MVFMFENLEVYKKAIMFVEGVYGLKGLARDYTIKDQLRRAALSIPLNIAEGQGRMHGKEKRQFYNTARGSLLECVPLIQVCAKVDYISNEDYETLYGMLNEISRMLSGLIKSVQTGDVIRK